MKKILSAVGFLCMFFIIYFFADATLELKTTDGIKTMQVYYELPPDTVDVLMVGSSHLGKNVDSSILWDEYGIASYNLWSGMQPVWNSYYGVKEALKTQSPKLVVLEVFLCAAEHEYSDASAAYKFIQGMDPSLDKVNAALSSFDTWQQAAEALWGMPFYHSRYDELTKEDFKIGITDEDITLPSIVYESDVVYPLSMLDYASITQALPLSEKSLTYLQKIIDLCKGQDIDLLFLIAPFQATQDESMHLNSVEQTAQLEDIPCLNYLKEYEQAGIDQQTDFLDIGHLNTKGIAKLSNDIGQYLNAHYDLPDRREDEDHLWHDNVAATQPTEPDYALEQQFSGDGISRNVDTGMKLYGNQFGSWTLLARLNTTTLDDDQVYFSCFSEVPDAGNYGLLVKKKDNGMLSVKLGGNIETEIAIAGDTLDLAIAKQSQSYTIYADGECVLRNLELPCGAYEGHLLIGCQELSATGEKFRFSQTQTLNLEVYQDQALGAHTIGEWEPPTLAEMPMPLGLGDVQPTLIYALAEQIMGKPGEYVQDAYLDTGLQLFDEPANSFTISARITPQTLAADNVFLACFSEEADHYRGLLIRQTQEDALNIIFGDNNGLEIPCTQGESIDLIIVKDVGTYTIFVNGEKMLDKVKAPCDAYAGSLLIGCQETAQGEKFRISPTSIQSLQVFSGIIEEQDFQELKLEDAPLPDDRIATSVDYQLSNAFLGDGEERYIDTGIQLYDVPHKDWTLGITLTPETSDASDVYIACFSEDAPYFRGLMLRQEGANTINIWVGSEKTHALTLTGKKKSLRLVIVKEGDQYSIYQNGALEAQLESACTAYDGNLLVGCQETTDGSKFRFSAVKVDALTVRDGAMVAEAAMQYSILNPQNSRF